MRCSVPRHPHAVSDKTLTTYRKVAKQKGKFDEYAAAVAKANQALPADNPAGH